MTREEAIEKVRQMSLPKETMEILETLAPELKESEDERIREEIISALKFANDGDVYDKHIAYLEKQKENPWSEEDEAIVKTMCEEGNLKPSERAWLMNLKNRKWKESLHVSETCKENPDSFTDEDERIRKALIEVLHRLPASTFDYGAEGGYVGATKEQMFAYLEKQKEPVPIPDKFSGLKSLMLQYLQSAANRKDDAEIEDDTDLWGRKILDYVWKQFEKQKEPHYTKRNALFDKCVENCDPEVMQRVSDEVDEMLQKEQKPEEKSINWTELTWKDIVELEGIINNVHYEFRSGIGQESFGKEVLEKFREYKGDEYLDEIEQKPASTPERIRPKFAVGDTICHPMRCDHTVQEIYVRCADPVYVCVNEEGLESHVSFSEQNEWKRKEQKPAEWSEGDEPHWKPNEKQMKALQNAIDACGSEWVYRESALRSLFTDLKKLI